MSESNQTTYAPYRPDALPPVVSRYLDAQKLPRGRSSVADAFAPRARVVDDGTEYLGGPAITEWLATAATGFSYTTTILGQTITDDDRWEVLAQLRGDFPGGEAQLRFRFRVEEERITELVIQP